MSRLRPVTLSETFSVTCAVTSPGKSELRPVIKLAAMTLPACKVQGDTGAVSLCGFTSALPFARPIIEFFRCWPLGSGATATCADGRAFGIVATGAALGLPLVGFVGSGGWT